MIKQWWVRPALAAAVWLGAVLALGSCDRRIVRIPLAVAVHDTTVVHDTVYVRPPRCK